MDARIAEHVMQYAPLDSERGKAAWAAVGNGEIKRLQRIEEGEDKFYYVNDAGGLMMCFRIEDKYPKFSTDIKFAMQIQAIMAQREYDFKLSYLVEAETDKWFCAFKQYKNLRDYAAVADTPELAICKAALSVHGIAA